jgi:methyl-accepting chemotaxis protein
LSLVLGISVVLLLLFTRQTTGMIEKNLRGSAETTLRYLESDILYTLAPSMELAAAGAAAVPHMVSRTQLSQVFRDMSKSCPEVFDMYYTTTLSRFEGGEYISASGYNPYITNPEYDQTKRPWFIFALQYPRRTMISEPYEDIQTGKICVTITRAVEKGCCKSTR